MQFHDAVRVRVPAKINLALAVGPRRADGFHDLTSVFQAVSIHDELIAVQRPDNLITLVMSGRGSEELPTDEQNLAVALAVVVLRPPAPAARLRQVDRWQRYQAATTGHRLGHGARGDLRVRGWRGGARRTRRGCHGGNRYCGQFRCLGRTYQERAPCNGR